MLAQRGPRGVTADLSRELAKRLGVPAASDLLQVGPRRARRRIYLDLADDGKQNFVLIGEQPTGGKGTAARTRG